MRTACPILSGSPGGAGSRCMASRACNPRAGQGLALARMPLVADSLATGDLVEVLPGHRLDSPLVYWLIIGPRSAQRPEVQAFCAWLQLQAKATREAIGEVPDSDLIDDIS